ncbi:DUF6344 domain-containing protein [Streptomyces sp. SPB162]|uniref:DUF6344 domain-containing protein n=1 Tax=Streptomyces sp. SPB162 TaxID=2940560 RepID=UPI00240699DE|nr:DUF6344 domain-containing protein [Streptomyces sp. SPB162]MDF9814541.1 hypothetical protein [Streptomyces sp. SPB162]
MATATSTAPAGTSKVAQLWTLFLGVLAGIRTALRLTTPARAAGRQPRTSERPAPVVPPARHAAFDCFAGSETRRERSLPPTIKQRIRAEAHGASPVSRQRTAGLGETAGPAVGAPAPVPADERFDRLPCAA